jgi:putative transposase
MNLPSAMDHAEELALFRSELVGALARRDLGRGELGRELAALSQVRVRPPGSAHTRTYSAVTLQRWYYAYRAGGLAALKPQPRTDRGHGRALPAELRELLCQIRREHPHTSAELIVRTLVTDGRMAPAAVSPSTVRRLFRQQGLDRVFLANAAHGKVRLRWQAERPNALWHGDVCHGPALRSPDGRTMPLRIHALMDDATRYIVGIEALHTEREADMLALWVRALRRHGAPDTIYLDNGSTYRGDALRLSCERIGTTLVHAKPYDAPARGKMERFWRTLRQGCLSVMGQLSSLHEVNVRLYAYLDEHYHRAPHAGLMGRAPGRVWHERASERPADLLNEQTLREALTMRVRRRVRRDTTLTLEGQTWELEAGFLAGRVVTVARCLLEPDSPPWIEHEGKCLPLYPVDPVANARRRRQHHSTTPQPSVPFDPPGALLDQAVGRTPRRKETP